MESGSSPSSTLSSFSSLEGYLNTSKEIKINVFDDNNNNEGKTRQRLNRKSRSFNPTSTCKGIQQYEQEQHPLYYYDKDLYVKLIRRCKSERFLHSWDYAPTYYTHLYDSTTTTSSSSTTISRTNSTEDFDFNNSNKTGKNIKKESKKEQDKFYNMSRKDSTSESRNKGYIVNYIDDMDFQINSFSEEETNWLNYLNEGASKEKVAYAKVESNTNNGVNNNNGNIGNGHESKTLKAASLNYLIKNMVFNIETTITNKEEYIEIILLTHTIYISSIDLFNKLESYYWGNNTTAITPTTSTEITSSNSGNNSSSEYSNIYNNNNKPVTRSDLERRNRVIVAIKKWIQYGEIRENKELIMKIELFIENITNSKRTIEQTWGSQLKEEIERKPIESPGIRRKLPKFTKSGFSILKKIDFKNICVCEIEPMEIVRHLTAVDWKLVKKIKTTELLKKAWSFPDKETQSPNIVRLITSFNKTAQWVASEILTTSNPKMRVKVLERFIEVLKGLKTVQNYHGLFVIYSALNMTCIQKLTTLWESVNSKHITTIREIERLIDSRSNFKNYRSLIKKIQLPYVPFEGLLLQDITFIEENPDTLDSMINFEKMEMLAKVLKTVKSMQQVPYKFKESAFIAEYIKRDLLLTEEELYKLSKNIHLSESQKSIDGFNRINNSNNKSKSNNNSTNSPRSFLKKPLF